MPIESALQNLLRFAPVTNAGVRDVLWDPETETVALVGPALTLERRLFVDGGNFFRNPHNSVDTQWAHLNGIQIERTNYGTRPQWFQEEMHISDFLQALSGAIRDAAGEDGKGEISVTFSPEPGYPYTPGRTKKLYSAKKNKWFTPEQPPYLMKTKDRDGKEHWGANFCQLAPLICGGSKYMAGQLGELPMLTTHCSPLATGVFGKVREEMMQPLRECKGFLFPSLAVGMIPATNFGETVFVVDPMVPLGGMKPYRGRGSYTAVTYTSDVWTEGGSELVGGLAIHTYEQLHGVPDWIYTSHFYILGPEIKETGFADEQVTPISGTRKLATTIARRYKKWPENMNLDKFKAMSEQMNIDRYAYLECKVNGIVGWDCIPLVATPKQFADKVAAALGSTGFKGRLLSIEGLPEEMLTALLGTGKGSLEQHNYLVYQYAWLAGREIFELAVRENKVMGVELA